MTHVMIFLFDVLTIWQISSQNRSESVKFQKRRTIEVCQIAKTKHVINFSKRNLKLEIGSNLSNSKNECISGHMTIASFKWILSNSKVHPVWFQNFIWKLQNCLILEFLNIFHHLTIFTIFYHSLIESTVFNFENVSTQSNPVVSASNANLSIFDQKYQKCFILEFVLRMNP